MQDLCYQQYGHGEILLERLTLSGDEGSLAIRTSGNIQCCAEMWRSKQSRIALCGASYKDTLGPISQNLPYPRLGEALADVDAVIVASATDTHFPYIMESLRADKASHKKCWKVIRLQ